MLWQSSYYIWSFLCLLTLDKVLVSSGITCMPGEKASHSRTKCEPCPPDQYNSKAGDSNECRNCDPCALNSLKISECTPISNTKCRCFDGFIPLDKAHRRCKCLTGSGIKTLDNGVKICEKCPPNTFTSTNNSTCQPLFAEGDKFPGNATSDVNHENKAKGVLTSSPFSLSQTSSITSIMIPTTSRNSVSTPTTSIPESQDNSKHALWSALLAAFLLVILILKFCRCPKKKIDIVRQDSACGKPVEESGEKLFPPIFMPQA